MALAVNVTFTILDYDQYTSTTVLHLPTGLTVSEYIRFTTKAAEVIAACIDGQIISARACVNLDLSSVTLRDIPFATSDRFQKATFIFRSIINGFRRLFNIPTFNEQKKVSGSENVDLSDADIQTFVTTMDNGIPTAGGTIKPVDDRGNELSGDVNAYTRFRKK